MLEKWDELVEVREKQSENLVILLGLEIGLDLITYLFPQILEWMLLVFEGEEADRGVLYVK